MGDWNLHSINWHCRFAGQREIWLTKLFKFHEKNQGGLFFLRKPLFRQEWFRDLPVLNGAAYVPFNVHQGTYCFRAQLFAKRTANEFQKKKHRSADAVERGRAMRNSIKAMRFPNPWPIGSVWVLRKDQNATGSRSTGFSWIPSTESVQSLESFSSYIHPKNNRKYYFELNK